jgi:vacuolar-type H+-ATPase subunit E/Vma4
MSSENELLGILSAESSAECKRIISDADSRAGRIIDQARSEASKLRDERFRKIEKKVGAEMAKAASSARLEGNKIVLRAKHSLIAEAFKESREKLNQIRGGKEYEEILEALMRETVPPGRGGFLLIDPRDQKLVRYLLSRLGMEIDLSPTLSCLGGVKYQNESKAISVDNTFESRLTRAREDLMVRAASVLFHPARGI